MRPMWPLGVVICCLVGASAAAQEGASTRLLDDVAACRTIAAADARLACFDRTSARVADARRRGEVVVVDRAAAIERQQRRFGLPGGREAAIPRPVGQPSLAVDALATTIRRVDPVPGGRWLLTLASGGTWQTAEATYRVPDAGAAIRIAPASLGGYRARIGSARPILVRRVR